MKTVEALSATALLSLFVSIPIFWTRKQQLVESSTSRKILHICMAPIFMFCWHWFPDNKSAKYFALLIPLIFTIVFFLIGMGVMRIPFIADAMSRSGNCEELAKGPFHYGICICAATLLFWNKIEALYCILPISFGDGFASFFGPSVKGNQELKWNHSKTWLGFLAFVSYSFLGLVGCIALFQRYDWLLNPNPNFILHSLLVSIMCGLTESVTVSNYDNFTVFAMGILFYNFIRYFVSFYQWLLYLQLHSQTHSYGEGKHRIFRDSTPNPV